MALGTLTLGSNVTSDFIYISATEPDTEIIDDIHYEPVWNPDSRFLATFTSTLIAGNLSAEGNPPTDWSIYRKKAHGSTLEFIGDVHGADVTIFDYAAPNNTEIQYISFPSTESRTASYSTSEVVHPSWQGWTLITLDDTEEDGLYYPHEIFMFSMNIEIGDFSNNTTFNRMENFTRYPTIQRSSANYLTGQLRALVGATDSLGRYYDTVEMINAVRALTTDTRRKILKDFKGHVWEVELSASTMFSVEQNLSQAMNSFTMQWAEVGDAKDIRTYINITNQEA